MRDFRFFGTWDDTWQHLTAILAMDDYYLVPDVRYFEPTPIMAKTLDNSVKSLCQDRGNTYIWSSRYSLFPPHMEIIPEGENAGKYFVDISKQGPGLELQIPPCYEKDGLIHLAPGSLWYQKRTFNTTTGLWYPPSTELKLGFQEVRAIIKKNLIWIDRGTMRLFIGANAMRLVEKHQAVLHGIQQ